MSFEHAILISNLEKVASGLRFRLASAFAIDVVALPYEPWQEVERSDAVDAACVVVAREVAAVSRETCNVAFRVNLELAELVLWRIRDAQRHLREAVPVWPKNSDVKACLQKLLVDSWHTYAEPYWLERREKFQVCVAEAGR